MACVCVISKHFDCHKCADCFEKKCPYGYKPTKKQKKLRHEQVLAARAQHAKQKECKHGWEDLELIEVSSHWQPYQKPPLVIYHLHMRCKNCGEDLHHGIHAREEKR